MKNKPKVSVIIPARDVENFIGRAIESVLNQTFKNFEIVIVDDMSSDRTFTIAKQYAAKDSRIRVYKNKKQLFIAGSLNKGLKLAKAPIIARMDADDVSMPRRLEIQYKYLSSHPKLAIIGANMLVVDINGKSMSERKYPTKSKDLKKVMFRYSPFSHPVVMYRKAAILEFGGYKLGIFPCEDIDLWFKVGSKYEFASIDKPLLRYTLISGSASHKALRNLEFLGLKIKIKAIIKYGYRPSLFDVIYNVSEYLTVWFIPAEQRIKLFNLLRSKGLI